MKKSNKSSPQHTLGLSNLSVCSRIEQVHFCGIVHRDLKPHNCLIGTGGNGDDRDDIKVEQFFVPCTVNKILRQSCQSCTNVAKSILLQIVDLGLGKFYVDLGETLTLILT